LGELFAYYIRIPSEELTKIVKTNLQSKKRIFEEYNNKANEEME